MLLLWIDAQDAAQSWLGVSTGLDAAEPVNLAAGHD